MNYSAAWTGLTYFQYEGKLYDSPVLDEVFDDEIKEEYSHHLLALLVRDYIPANLLDIPANLLDIPAKDIDSFRIKRIDERRRLVNSIKEAAEFIYSAESPEVLEGRIQFLKKEIEESLIDYRKSADILKVREWTGIKSLSFPVSSLLLSRFADVSSYCNLSILSATGVAAGVITAVAGVNQQLGKLAKEHKYSYLLELRRNWQDTYRGYDYNYLLQRKIEEFIND